jgi:hypothetical protein
MDRHGKRAAALSLLVLVSLVAALARAGDLEPPGPPGPTMKTLEEIPGSWHRILPSGDGEPDGCNSSRFKCVMNDEAVLDLETGLVWQRHVSTSWQLGKYQSCSYGTLAGTRSFRKPTLGELLSLRVDAGSGEVALPAGHPFTGVEAVRYWTTTGKEGIPTENGYYWTISFDGGSLAPELKIDLDGHRVWCVRGSE